MKARRSFILCILATLTLMLFPLSTFAQAIASIDRSVIGIDETFRLTLRVGESSIRSDPDLSPLENDFEVINNSKSSRYSLVNGKAESTTEWTITLAPRREGKLTIPALRIGSSQTLPLDIRVSKAASKPAGAQQNLFIEVELDSEDVYVQAQALLTVRVYHSVNLDQGASLSEPEIADTLVHKISETSYAKMLEVSPIVLYVHHRLQQIVIDKHVLE